MLVKVENAGYVDTSESEFGKGKHVHINRWPDRHELLENGYRVVDAYADYGVADTVKQILKHHSKYVNDKNKMYYLSVFGVWPEDEPERDGWRWHKWGPYIGEYDSHYEYIYDDYYSGDLAKFFDDKGMGEHAILVYRFIEVVPV